MSVCIYTSLAFRHIPLEIRGLALEKGRTCYGVMHETGFDVEDSENSAEMRSFNTADNVFHQENHYLGYFQMNKRYLSNFDKHILQISS